MLKTRKGILLIVLALCVVLIASVVGVAAFAQTDSSGTDVTQPSQQDALLNKVTEIYQQNTGVTLDTQQLKDAFTQAQSELRQEELQTRLNNMVQNGEITQEEADQYLSWWQSRPDSQILEKIGPGMGGMTGDRHSGPGFGGRFAAPSCEDSNTGI